MFAFTATQFFLFLDEVNTDLCNSGRPQNWHCGHEYDGSYESSFTTRCLLHNYSIVTSAV